MNNNSKSVQFATMTILHAGNARKLISDAYINLSEFNFNDAREKIKAAKEEALFAHREQSKIIHAESMGEYQEISLLITHAQDTLTSAVSELYIAKSMITVIENLYIEVQKK